jgi:hypothetical protein
MQFAKTLVMLFAATAALTSAQYDNEHFLIARETVANAAEEYMVARRGFELLKRVSTPLPHIQDPAASLLHSLPSFPLHPSFVYCGRSTRR